MLTISSQVFHIVCTGQVGRNVSQSTLNLKFLL